MCSLSGPQSALLPPRGALGPPPAVKGPHVHVNGPGSPLLFSLSVSPSLQGKARHKPLQHKLTLAEGEGPVFFE